MSPRLVTAALVAPLALLCSCAEQGARPSRLNAEAPAETPAEKPAETPAETPALRAHDDASAALRRALSGDGEAPALPPLPELAPPAVASSAAEDLGAAGLSPDPWDPEAFSRARKRMDLDQLARAFEQFDGGVGWRVGGRVTGSDRWRQQWAALGGPNFITRVTEDRRPSVLFTKLIRDAAMEVCAALVARELPSSGAPAAPRVLVTTPDPAALPADDAPTREAVAALLWRAHGVDLAADDPEVGRWVTLAAEVAAESGSAAEAWRALCVAALVHPRFWSY